MARKFVGGQWLEFPEDYEQEDEHKHEIITKGGKGGSVPPRKPILKKRKRQHEGYITQDSDARKLMPVASGCIDYFGAALAEVARVSMIGNLKHNGPDVPLHHARGKSMDHADCIARHLIDRGGFDVFEINKVPYKVRHSAYLAWRALALLQQELEDADEVPMARAAKETT